MASASIFFDFNLPNATTWFYFSFLLAVALFFKFSRLLSVRNWDIVTVFLLVPGLLVIQEARPRPTTPEKNPALAVASAVGGAVPTSSLTPITSLARTAELGPAPVQLLWLGYLWLLCGSAYFLVRCVFDLALVRRPALPPNLSFGGLAWLGGALFVCLVAVAFRQPEVNSPTPSRGITTPVAENGVTSEGARQVAVGRQSPLVQLAQRPFPLWVMRSLAVLCHLAVVVGLVGIGWRHFLDAPAGIAAATFYLMLPYTGLYVGQVHHVWPTALIVWAIAFFRRPMVAGAFLGLAAGTIYFPVVLLPLWLSFYWGRGVGRFAAAFFVTAGLMVACTALILWLRPDWAQHIGETIAASDWQPW
ncbi:MAG TPA: hypothetical protein VEL76_07575, partial [Gemmataceae bacterium]|nr:hypothetical protein [Gemmataceae bacterium]